MAFDFSKLNFFSKLDAKARIIVLIGAVAGAIFLVYLLTQYLAGDSSGISTSKVAAAPRGLQTVPGGQQTPEFSKAVEQANLQRAQQAQLSGQSAVPTLVNTGMQAGSACVICEDQTPNVKSSLDQWVKEGKISPEVSKQLFELANQNVSVDDYARQLDDLVKAGKLTPAQARELLEIYKKQHSGALVQQSAKIMDDMIKSGEVPVSEANKLLEMQRQNASTSDYSNKLQEMVAQGKISQATAQKLLTQYTQQRAKDVVARSIASLKAMASSGQITPDVEAELTDLEQRMVSLDLYSSTLDKFVAGGKMTPVVASKILEEFKAQKAEIGSTGSLTQIVDQAEAAAYGDLNNMLKSGKINQQTADQIADMMKRNVSMDEYKNNLDRLVQEGKLAPDDAKRLLARYAAVKGSQEVVQKLANLQANNASAAEYADALKQAVQAGLITPERAAQLMQEYQAVISKTPVTTTVAATGASSEAFAELQKRLQQSGAGTQTTDFTSPEFATVQTESTQESAQEAQQRIEDLQSAMSAQAQQLISSWQPPTMANRTAPAVTTTTITTVDKNGAAGGAGSETADAATAAATPALIKAGTIQFAVLDTEANSDYPDSPIMATVVDGKLKGAKLLGKLRTVKGVAGQMDRISLEFTLMNMDAWPKSRAVNAYAIDPDTARTVLASHVNYHYLQRFGAMMATSFIQGYATGITSSSSTTTTGIFGTSTTTPELSPGNKIAVGLGQVGQALGDVTKNYVNIPPTVKVDSGVGLGILFMSDVS